MPVGVAMAGLCQQCTESAWANDESFAVGMDTRTGVDDSYKLPSGSPAQSTS
jgi:hypothetical protein